MAETKKTNVSEETKEVIPKEKETEYGIDELIAASDQLFYYHKNHVAPKDCVVVALKMSQKKTMTVTEAQKLVTDFMKKEVK